MKASVRIPATSANLGPGFDTFGMALSLFNTVEAELSDGNLRIEVTGDGAHLVPRTKENTVYQAMRAVFDKAGETQLLTTRQVRIHIHNDVPVTRGLGSSATAIVGGLWAANHLLHNPLSEQDLLEMAVTMEGHPDNIAPAVYGGVVVCGVVDGTTYVRKFAPPPGMQCVVAVPHFQLSTKASRKTLPPAVPHADASHNVNRASLMVTALLDANLELLCRFMEDKLHEPYRVPLVPGMKQARSFAREAGALSVALSGSGPSVIAFCKNDTEAVANALRAGFQAEGILCDILHVTPCEHGVKVTQ